MANCNSPSEVRASALGPRMLGLRTDCPADRLLREALDDVALGQVVEVGQADAALEVLLHLADIVAEAPQRLDPVGRDDLATAPHPGSATHDPAVGHEAARDHRALADLEDLTDLCPTLDDFDDFRLE